MANGTYKLSEQPGYNRQLAMAIGEVRDIAESASITVVAGTGINVSTNASGEVVVSSDETSVAYDLASLITN